MEDAMRWVCTCWAAASDTWPFVRGTGPLEWWHYNPIRAIAVAGHDASIVQVEFQNARASAAYIENLKASATCQTTPTDCDHMLSSE